MNQTTAVTTKQANDSALKFAQAHCRWRVLSTDQRNWQEPDRQRVLAGAFLQYHMTKLALAEQGTPPSSDSVTLALEEMALRQP